MKHPKMVWTGRIIAWVICALFVFSASMKIRGGEEIAKGFEHFGIGPNLVFPLGILEIVCALIYLIPTTSVLGAILLTGYMGGAIMTHLRMGENIVLHIVIGILIWGSLFLRDGRMRQLIPLRSK